MTSARDELLGVYLAGRYRLEEWLGADDSADFFMTSIAGGEYPAGTRGVVKLAPGDAPASSRMLSIWKRTAALSHPNVLRLLDCGRADAAGGSFVYGVFEHPDETLASVLEQRALDPQESREVHADMTAALRYIHSHGLAHGTVDPEHIVAVGDRIKLASDGLREAGPGCQPADDLRALARMGFGPEPEPAAEAQRPPIPPPPSAPLASAPGRRAPSPAPTVSLPSPRPTAAHREDSPPARRPLSIPVWAYVAIAVVLVLAVVAIRKSSQKGAEPAAVTATPAATAPVDASPAKSDAPKPPAPKEPVRARSAWRVIAYTYSTHRDAEKKARAINTRHPALRAEVFAPRGKDRSPYMVALGGRMTREEAARLQKQAKSKGMPRDTFIRNYSE